jgi:hypothetical protein
VTGVTLLLVLCLGAVVVVGIAAVHAACRTDDERVGCYGARVRRRRLDADADLSTAEAIAARTELSVLAHLVAVLDRQAWTGVPIRSATLDGHTHRWTIEFRDGTSIEVGSDDDVHMRRVTNLARHVPLVVGRVHPDGRSARVLLWSSHHGELSVAVRA